MNPLVNAMLAADPDPEAWKTGFSESTAHSAAGALGVELIEIDAERVVLRMPITNAARQPFGLLHGGISMVLAESAASMHACWGVDIREVVPVGIEINGSHLRSAREGWVRATATVVRRSRTLVVHEVRIEHEDTGKLLNVSRVTNLYTKSPLAGG